MSNLLIVDLFILALLIYLFFKVAEQRVEAARFCTPLRNDFSFKMRSEIQRNAPWTASFQTAREGISLYAYTNPSDREADPSVAPNDIWDGIFILDVNNRVVFWNQGMKQFTGLSAEDVLGRLITSLGDVFLDLDVLLPMLQTLEAVYLDNVLKAKTELPELPTYMGLGHLDGRTLRVAGLFRFLVIESKPAGLLGVVRAAASLPDFPKETRRDPELYRKLLEQTQDAMLIASLPEGIVIEANQAASVMLGYPLDELKGMRLSLIDDQHLVPETDITDYDAQTYDTSWLHKVDLQIPVSVQESHFWLNDNRCLLLTGRDFRKKQISWVEERQQRKLAEALRDVAEALNSTLDIDVLLDRILNNLEKVISFVTANVMFVEKGRTFIASGRGYTTDRMEKWRQSWDVPVDDFPILKRMAETGHPVVFPDTWREPAWVRLSETDWIRSYAGAPIFRGGRLYGFINVNSDVPGEYGERSIVHLRAFADQAAIALENARLFTETQKRAERLELLNEIATSINEPGSLEKVLDAAADGLAKVLDVEQTGIALMDEDGRNLTVVAEHTAPGVPSAVGSKIPVNGNASMEFMLEQLKPLPVFEAQNDPLLANIHAIMLERRVNSILLVPLVVHGRLVGTIGCDVINAPRHFSDEEIHLAETLAGMISTRIEQTRLLESIQRHARELEKMREILHVINATPDISLGMERVAKTIKELTGCSRVSLALLTETGEQFLLITIDQQIEGLKNGIPINISETAAASDVLEGEVHVTPDLAQEADFAGERALYEAGFRSRVNFPLIINERIIGSLNLVWNEINGFAGNDLSMIRQLAEAVAMAVERGRLLEETQRRDAILEILAYAAEHLMHVDDLAYVIPDLLTRLGKITGASRAYLFRNSLDPDGSLLMSEDFGWIDENIPAVSTQEDLQNLPYHGSGLGRWIGILSSGEPVHGLVRDFPESERIFLSREKILSIAIVPVFVRGVWWGFLGFDDCRWSRIWTFTEIEALKNLGDTIGGAIARIQSEKAEREQLSLTEALREVTNVMTATTNIEQVFQHILDSITRIMKHDASNIMLLKAGMLEITCAQGYVEAGLPDPAVAFPRPISEFKNFVVALETGDSQIVSDTHLKDDWLRLPEVRWVRSNLNAPIRYKDQTIGFINLDSSVPNFFNEEDAKKLLAFANQAAVAIENTRLFEETHERALQMSLLNRITQAAIGAGTIDDVLHTLVVQIAALMNADLAFINLLDEHDRSSQITMSSANTFTRVTNPDLLKDISSLTQEALRRGHVQFFEDLRIVEFLEQTMVQQLGGASLMTLPLISGDQHFGGTVIIYQHRKVFDVNMLALGEQAAGQIALAIAKTRLLEAERQKSETLARINTILTALSHVAVRLETARVPEEVMETLGEELRKLGIACTVWMVSSEHDALILRYASLTQTEIRMVQRLLRTPLEAFRLNKDAFEYFDPVIERREAIFIENFPEALHTVIPSMPARVFHSISNRIGLGEQVSGFFLPLMAEEKVIGTIWMLAQQFTQHDQTAATIFSGQVAMALENTRLYQHIQQLAITDELTKLYNRRGLMELGNREFDRARRFNRSLCAIMFDLDDFRRVNNTFGHAVGDEVLREVAARCRTVLRSTDVIGRYGGEEFSVLLPETDITGTEEIAERLRTNVSVAPIDTSKGRVRISISLGVAAHGEQCESLTELLDWADQGLYMAKRNGKNRVCISPYEKNSLQEKNGDTG